MGFDYYALLHHVSLSSYSQSLDHMERGELVALSTYPESWVATYVERNIVAEDPILLASQRTNVGFRWDEIGKIIDLTPAHHEIRIETARAGIENGFTVPAHVPGEANGSCNFAMRCGRPLPVANLQMAQLVGAFAFQAARELVRKAERRHLDPPPKLTHRQLECIVLVGKGYTEGQIGRTLGISDETVKRHLKEARLVYDVPKSVQVLVRALFDGQVPLTELLRN